MRQIEMPVKPVCEGMGRKEITSLLSRELIRCRLERRNAYSYWAHEVEMHDYAKGKSVWVDFVQFEPDWYHQATHAGCVERGTFTFYEVKSCIGDIKSGHGLNLMGDENYIVMPVEAYYKLNEAWGNGDKKLRETLGSYRHSCGYLLYGEKKNGWRGFYEVDPITRNGCRKKPADELLLCMMRALIANSDRSDVEHKINQSTTF